MNVLNESYFSVPVVEPKDAAEKFYALLQSRIKFQVIVSDEQVRADEPLDDDIIVDWFKPLGIRPIDLDGQKPPIYDPNLLEIGPFANLINVIYTAAVIQMSIDKHHCIFQKLHKIRDIGEIKREKDTCFICIEIERALHIIEHNKMLKKQKSGEMLAVHCGSLHSPTHS